MLGGLLSPPPIDRLSTYDRIHCWGARGRVLVHPPACAPRIDAITPRAPKRGMSSDGLRASPPPTVTISPPRSTTSEASRGLTRGARSHRDSQRIAPVDDTRLGWMSSTATLAATASDADLATSITPRFGPTNHVPQRGWPVPDCFGRPFRSRRVAWPRPGCPRPVALPTRARLQRFLWQQFLRDSTHRRITKSDPGRSLRVRGVRLGALRKERGPRDRGRRSQYHQTRLEAERRPLALHVRIGESRPDSEAR